MFGDFNFTAFGDTKVPISTHSRILVMMGFACFRQHFCVQYAELAQDDFAWTRGGSYSRIDRVYTPLRSSDLIDVKPSCCVAWTWNSPTTFVRDHLPLSVRFPAIREGVRRHVLPTWVATHPSYSQCCSKIISTSGGCATCPLQAHTEAKEIIQQAAQHVPNQCRHVYPYTLQQQIYTTIKAHRHARRGAFSKFQTIAKVFTRLHDFGFDQCVDCSELHNFLGNPITQQAETNVEFTNHSPTD
jgi:hypothetical protein